VHTICIGWLWYRFRCGVYYTFGFETSSSEKRAHMSFVHAVLEYYDLQWRFKMKCHLNP